MCGIYFYSIDIKQMLSTFSVESYAQNYNLQAYTEYQQAYILMHQTVKFPPVNDFTQMLLKRKGIAPLEAIIDPADLEEVITYI